MPRTQSRRRSAGAFFDAPRATEPTPWLVAATDLGFLAALSLVPLCLGGRLAIGQGVLVGTAIWVTGCWSLHQVFARECQWIWTRIEWLWAAAIALVVLQLTSLPTEWMESLSPYHAQVLPEWSDSTGSDVLNRRWSVLSFDPAETRSSLATFLAYGLLFVIAVQRFREQRDIERGLRWIAVTVVAMAVFSLGQYAFGNGKYFGVLQHPYASTHLYAVGSFTNRNHLAQFLAFGVGPLLWWWVTICRTGTAADTAGSSFGGPPANRVPLHILFIAAIGTVIVALLMTQSRGGVLALAVVLAVSLWGLHRSQLISWQVVIGLLVTSVAIGAAGWAAGAQEVVYRIDHYGKEGRWPVWNANLETLRHFPWVGTGVSTHVYSHQLFLDREYVRREYTHADNSYLQVASECGSMGLAIAALAILTCCGWLAGVLYRRTDASVTAIAAALSASLTANLVHAVFDFLWFVPGLMVSLVIVVAAARRLSQLDLQAAGRVPPRLPCARLCWTGMLGTLMALGPWLWAQKAHAIASEPAHLRLLNLMFQPETVFPLDDQPETQQLLLQEKTRCALRAAKANPHDGHAQLNAALACREMFDQLQERSDNPMTFAQLRDALLASGFLSEAEARTWMLRAAGKNMRLLDAAWKYATRCIEESPFEAPAYVLLAELSLLHDSSGQLQQRLLDQALAVRPYDPDVLFAAGQEALVLSRQERAMELWRRAFRYGPVLQKRIANVLAVDRSAQFFLETFEPDWQAQECICEAFRTIGRTEELDVMLRSCADAATASARDATEEGQAVRAWLTARNAWRELKQPERAMAALNEGAHHYPHSFDLRCALGSDLFEQRQFAAAATHLKWAAGHKPDDAALKNLAEEAVRAALNAEARSDRVTPSGYRR